ncbi:MAG: hypothetical protein JWP91_3004 [Fibrobacteres bacterium]|nr:hypothetical protein [Fibrobacterota bacterium]
MEMTRMLLASLLCAVLSAGAGDIAPVAPAEAGVKAVSARGPDRILILRADGANFKETANGLIRELGPEFEIEDRILGSADGAAPSISDPGRLAAAIAKSRPKALVLMDNDAINLYASVQKQWRDTVPFPPSISLMAIRVDKAIGGLKRATGIFYEVPGVTIFVNLRSLVSEPVRKVGVILRPSMADFVRESAKWCKYENIELVPYEIEEDRKDVARAIRTGMRRLGDRDKVDALWILNDNFFLTPEIIGGGWLPALERFHKPVLVGVENFVSTRANFGTFAILPDHYGLGVQAAGMVLRLKEDDWEIDGKPKVEQPLAVYKVLNLEQARKSAHVNQAALVEVDRVIK